MNPSLPPNNSLDEDSMSGLSSIIEESVSQTLETLFHVHADSYQLGHSTYVPSDAFVCRADLKEAGNMVSLFFSFDEALLRTLLKDLYSADMLQDPHTFSDAASEIANIVGGQVKSYLNQKGHNLLLDIPFRLEALPARGEFTHVHFSIDNTHLVIDVVSETH